MSHLQYLTNEESDTITENVEALINKMTILRNTEATTPTLEDGSNPWEYFLQEIDKMDIIQILEVAGACKHNSMVNTPNLNVEYQYFNTLMNVFSNKPFVDENYNVRGMYVLASLANLFNNAAACGIDQYADYTMETASDASFNVILETRHNPSGGTGWHAAGVKRRDTSSGREYMVRDKYITGNAEEIVAKMTSEWFETALPTSDDIDAATKFSNDKMANLRPKSFVLVAKRGTLGVCDQETLNILSKVCCNPLRVSSDGWNSLAVEQFRFISGFSQVAHVQSVCDILGAYYLRTSVEVGKIQYLEVHNSEFPVEVWTPLIESYPALAIKR